MHKFVEFSLVDKEIVHDTSTWDLTKQTSHGFLNTMEWDSKNKAFRSHGNNASETIVSNWIPKNAGPKTACVWKQLGQQFA